MKKRFAALVSHALVVLLLTCTLAGAEEDTSAAPRLQKIKHTVLSPTSEQVVLQLNGSYSPKVSTLKDENPRIIFDFDGMTSGKEIRAIATANGSIVKRVRVGRHDNPAKTRIVFDLTTFKGLNYTQEFDEASSSLVVSFTGPGKAALPPPKTNDAEAAPAKKTAAAADAAAKAAPPAQQEQAVTPPPSDKEQAATPAKEALPVASKQPEPEKAVTPPEKQDKPKGKNAAKSGASKEAAPPEKQAAQPEKQDKPQSKNTAKSGASKESAPPEKQTAPPDKQAAPPEEPAKTAAADPSVAPPASGDTKEEATKAETQKATTPPATAAPPSEAAAKKTEAPAAPAPGDSKEPAKAEAQKATTPPATATPPPEAAAKKKEAPAAPAADADKAKETAAKKAEAAAAEADKAKEAAAKKAEAAAADADKAKEAAKSSAILTQATDKPPQLEYIKFDDSSPKGEMVMFKLNGFHPPAIHGVEEGTPRVICDFNNTKLVQAVKGPIKANGKFVKVIRASVTKKPDKVRVVIDLEPNRSYDLQQVFFKEDNLFVLFVNTVKK